MKRNKIRKYIRSFGKASKNFISGNKHEGDIPRFQKFSERKFLMEPKLSDELFKSIQASKNLTNNKAGVKWKGASFCKDPFTTAIYLQLLQELKPKTVIEIGSLEGGSAVWFFDMLKSLDVESNIYSYDIDLSRIKFSDSKNIEFFNLDSNNIEEEFIFPDKIDRPLLIVEDAHINLKNVLNFLCDLMHKGDYLVVEDTIPFYGENSIYKDFQIFLEEHEDELLVDSYFTDNFGYNVSWNWNSFLKKVK